MDYRRPTVFFDITDTYQGFVQYDAFIMSNTPQGGVSGGGEMVQQLTPEVAGLVGMMPDNVLEATLDSALGLNVLGRYCQALFENCTSEYKGEVFPAGWRRTPRGLAVYLTMRRLGYTQWGQLDTTTKNRFRILYHIM